MSQYVLDCARTYYYQLTFKNKNKLSIRVVRFRSPAFEALHFIAEIVGTTGVTHPVTVLVVISLHPVVVRVALGTHPVTLLEVGRQSLLLLLVASVPAAHHAHLHLLSAVAHPTHAAAHPAAHAHAHAPHAHAHALFLKTALEAGRFVPVVVRVA